jgi:uncharacterized protein YjiS (DUF1127 family)
MRTRSCLAASSAQAPAPRRRRWGGLVAACSDLLLTWMSRSRGRRALATLSEPGRKDIGLSAADVDAEYRKPFWRA